MIYTYATPTRFLKVAGRILPFAIVATIATFCAGLYLALLSSPPDYQQGETVRIMYVHVPAAWMALGVFAFMATASAIFLIWKHPLAGYAAKAAAPIGACFTLVSLLTGSLWGKPMWGAWWVWDARLTSVLILFFLYIGYIVCADAFKETQQGLFTASIVAIVGCINLPIIKFSVEWWNTLHQPASIFRTGGSAIHSSMLKPLLLMTAAYGFFFVTILLLRIHSELALQKQRAQRIKLVRSMERKQNV